HREHRTVEHVHYVCHREHRPAAALYIASRAFFTTGQGPPTSALFPYTTLFRSRRSGLICLARSSRTGLDMSHILFMVEILISKPDRKSGSAGMPRPISYAVFCLKKKKLRVFMPSVKVMKPRSCALSSHVAVALF